MIKDLAESTDNEQLTADVAIVGAGVAGLLLATKLADRGHRVVVLESGGRLQAGDTHPLNEVVQDGDFYAGATKGRFRCLGGTSSRWGGALIPLLEDDYEERSHVGLPAWPVRRSELHCHLPQVERLFGVDRGSYEEDFIREVGSKAILSPGDSAFRLRFAKWPTFRRRNVALLLARPLESHSNLQVWTNATVADFDLDREAGLLTSMHARHESGRSITVVAQSFVICAGAIESTRLMLMLNRLGAGQADTSLGRYFFDHISAKIGELRSAAPTVLNRVAGFRFVGKTMRSVRFELSPEAQRKNSVGSAFGHISFRAERPGGFDALRSTLRTIQRRGYPSPGQIALMLQDAPYLSRALLWRVAHQQLYWPTPAAYELHVAAEQLPQAANKISLADARDRFGMPLAAIDWRMRPQDFAAFSVFKNEFERYWMRKQLTNAAAIDWIIDGNVGSSAIAAGDVFHPGGTTRMSDSARNGVVDRDLRCFAIPNLWVSSTSVFPSGASANPTLTLMLLTLRLAEHLTSRLSQTAGARVDAGA